MEKISPVIEKDITKALYQRSVKFGDIPRYNDQDKWPFWMPLIAEPPIDDTLAPFPQAQSAAGWSRR